MKLLLFLRPLLLSWLKLQFSFVSALNNSTNFSQLPFFLLFWLYWSVYSLYTLVAISHLLKVMSVYALVNIDRLTTLWKSDLLNKIECKIFHVVVVSVLLYGCTTWTLTKRLEKKLVGELHKDAAGCFEQILEAAPLQNSIYMATCLPFHKPSK